MSGFFNGIINGNGSTPVIYTGADKATVTPVEGAFYIDYTTPAAWTYHNGAWVNVGGGGGGGGVTSLGGVTGAITLGSNLSMVGSQLTVTIPVSGVTSFGGATGAITLGTNLSMIGNQLNVTIPTSGVTSFGGVTGAVTLGANLSMAGNQLNVANSGVTSFGGATGAITLGTGLSMTGNQLNTTAFLQGGNSFAALATIGTNDSNSFRILTNGVERARFNATTTELMIGTTTAAGVQLNVFGTSNFGNNMIVGNNSTTPTIQVSNSSTGAVAFATQYKANSTSEVINLINQNAAGMSSVRFSDSAGGFHAGFGYSNSAATVEPSSLLFFFNQAADNLYHTTSVQRLSALTYTGQYSLTSTVITGTATTAKPKLLVEPTGTTSTGWNTGGTMLGVNAPSAFAGALMDCQLNGSSKMRFDAVAGQLMIGTTTVLGGSVLFNVAGNYRVDAAGNSVGVQATQNQVIVPGSVGGLSLTMANAATAPGTSVVVLPTSVYGTGASVLTTPANWFIVRVNGNDYKVPCYT